MKIITKELVFKDFWCHSVQSGRLFGVRLTRDSLDLINEVSSNRL